MQAGMSYSVRFLVVLVVVLGLPLLAVPSVNQQLSAWIYGRTAEPLPQLTPSAAQESQISRPAELAPVSFDHPVELTAPAPLSNGLDQQTASPPAFERSSVFAKQSSSIPQEDASPRAMPVAVSPPAPLPVVAKADWKERVTAVRLQLERWGADYLLLEGLGESGYRFHCRMAVGPSGRETQAFESVAQDAASAAEQVLDEVALWRAQRLRTENR